MPLPTVSGARAVRAFERSGWAVDRQHGSHVILKKSGIVHTLSVPLRDELRPGTLRSLVRKAGPTVEQFIDLLD